MCARTSEISKISEVFCFTNQVINVSLVIYWKKIYTISGNLKKEQLSMGEVVNQGLNLVAKLFETKVREKKQTPLRSL